MKYAKDVNVPVILHEIRDSVVPEQQYAYVTRGSDVAITDLWKSD